MTADEFCEFRLRLRWTRLQLAVWSGASVRTITRFERGEQRIPEIWRRALAGLAVASSAGV
jgi:transcriptional regulator with XRE-family HTH domain